MSGSETSESAGSAVVRVFGGIGVDAANGPVSIGGRQQRRLLALLTLRAGSVASIDWLAEHMWADADRPEATTPAIRTYISRLRQVLPESAQEWLITESAGYLFDAPSTAIEHRRFADLRAQARSARERADPLAAMQLLDDALGLWRGEPFQELEDFDVARATIEELQLDRLEVLEERWESALALGRHTQITGELAVFATEHRLRDRATRQYALALHRSGRTPEALRVIAGHREYLADESGLDPSSEVLELEQAMLTDDPSLEVEKVGRPLRGYRLLDEIGSGAFSIVWRGMQPSVGREVAIKQIRSELASQPEFIRRFEAEAHLIARIEHPHVVPLIDFWRDPDSAYLVMRLLRGETLERRLDDGPLTVEHTLTLAGQIGGALSAAHGHNIIHRDVKTGNIMFDETGNAFLGDFGIALEASESTGPAAKFSTGSPAYSAPEQIRREPLGPQADVFSLGVVLYECITGSLPFTDSSSVSELVERQLYSVFPRVTEIRPEVAPHISEAIAKATAKTADHRFNSVAEFLTALRPEDSNRVPPEAAIVGLTINLPNPYLGLSAFDEADRDNFFGRDAIVNALLARFQGTGLASRCIGVIGPSGSGKSSVVRAGLSPALRMGAISGSEQWFATTMVPGDNPFESLEAALLRIAVNPPSSLLDQLQDGKRGVLRCLRRCLGEDTDKIYLVIDQFEEIFTSGDDKTPFDFLEALAVAVEDPRSPLRLVFTLRADYYDRPLSHPLFARIVDAAAVNVTPLSADELERAIVGPAERVGANFEPGLVALIVADCIGQPAPLPLLQYTLSELFERRDGAMLTIAVYQDIGRLTGALARRAEAIHSQATEPQRSAIRRTFGRMISPTEGTADLRRRIKLSDLGEDPSTTWVLQRFGDARLLTFDREPTTREPTVEAAHEALLREWPRLASWLNEDRDLLRSSEAIALAAEAWQASGRPEADLYRGARLENAIALTNAAPDRLRPVDDDFIQASQHFAETERRIEHERIQRLQRMVALAQQSEAEAKVQTQRAELATLISRSAAASSDDAGLSLLLALEAHRRTSTPETQQSVLNALGSNVGVGVVATAPLMFGPDETCGPTGSSPSRFSFSSRTAEHTAVPLPLQYGVVNGHLATRDLLSGEIIEYDSAPESCVFWYGDPELDRRCVASADGKRFWFGPYQGPLDVEVELEGRLVFWDNLHASHRTQILTNERGVFCLTTYDDRTGEQSGDQILIEAEDFTRGRVDANPQFLILSFYLSPLADPLCRLLLINRDSGDVVLDVRPPQPLLDVVIDEPAGEIIGVRNIDGTLITMDLATGRTLAIVETADVQIAQISLRPDGLILAVSGNRAQLIDRRLGRVGEPKPLPDVSWPGIRADGLLEVQTSRGFEVLDIDANGLAERTHDIDTPSIVTIRDGLAVTAALDVTGAEFIDLSTGERRSFGQITAEGIPAYNIAPVDAANLDEGVWAISRQGISRWKDDQVIESLRWDLLPFGERQWYFDQYAHIRVLPDESHVAELFNLSPDNLAQTARIPVLFPAVVHPTAARGLFVVDANGRMLTYSNDGTVTNEIDTGVVAAQAIALDQRTNQLAIGGHGVTVIDLASNAITNLRQTSPVANLGFAQAGTLLATSGSDGTVRLWDIARGVFAGVAWTGTGAVRGNAPQNDPTGNTMWFATSDKLIEIPLNPDRWVQRACELAGRNFTQEEWDLFVPGDEPLQSACD